MKETGDKYHAPQGRCVVFICSFGTFSVGKGWRIADEVAEAIWCA